MGGGPEAASVALPDGVLIGFEQCKICKVLRSSGRCLVDYQVLATQDRHRQAFDPDFLATGPCLFEFHAGDARENVDAIRHDSELEDSFRCFKIGLAHISERCPEL